MTRAAAPLVLASASPRRQDILRMLGVPFRAVPSDADEASQAGEAPRELALRLAALKAEIVARRQSPAATVLAADTVVVVDQAVLGKPEDDADARRMLGLLAGRTHEVVTGVSLQRRSDDYRDDFAATTAVTFRALDDDTIARYVASGEGRDKAGSYAVQGLGAGLVASIRGCYTNVVGLPAVSVLQALARADLLTRWP